MAELSDSDKRILLGENYKAEAEARRASSGVTDAMYASRERDAKYAAIYNASIYIGIVAAVIFGANYFATAFPYSTNLAIFSAVAFLIALAAGFWARNRRQGIATT